MSLGRLWFFVCFLCHVSISPSCEYEIVGHEPASCMKPVENYYQPICTVLFREEGSFATFNATCLEPNVFLVNPNRSQATTDLEKTEDYQYFAVIYNEQLPPYARINCSAAFPINFDFDGVGALDFFRIWKSQKQFPDHITYSVHAEVLLAPEATGRYIFYSIDDPKNRTEIFIFSERGSKPYLIGGNRIIQAVQPSPLIENKTILPCISTDLKPNITLFQPLGSEPKGNWTAIGPAMSYEYVRQIGFVFNKKLPPGDYKCSSSIPSPQIESDFDKEDYVIVRVINATDLQNTGKKLSNFKIEFTKAIAVCYSLQNGTSHIYFTNAHTENPTESHLLIECLKRKQAYCGRHSYHKRREAKRINRRCPASSQSCMWITDVHSQGIFYCSAGDDSGNFDSVEYFTGLDGDLYKTANSSTLNPAILLTPTWEPDNSSTELSTGVGYSMYCNAAGLVLTRGPYTISTVHKNGSTIKLGDTKSLGEIFLTTDVTEIICTDSLWFSHANVSMGRKIDVMDKPCLANFFTCKNNQCIMDDMRCDGRQNCQDSSDEADCLDYQCNYNQFKCRNGKCVPMRYRCDKENDCSDGSDEDCDAPTLIGQEFIETKIVLEHESVTMRCDLAEPSILSSVRFNWLQNNKMLKKNASRFKEIKLYEIQDTNFSSTLTIFDSSVDSSITSFTCEAINQNNERARKQKHFLLKVYNNTLSQKEAESVAVSYAYIAGIAIVIVATTSLISYVSFRHLYKKKINLTDEEIDEFRNGKARNVIDKLLNPMQELDYGPYNRKFEIPSSQFQIDTSSVLGRGQFGIVYKGLHNHKPIAAKTINPNAHSEKSHLLALLSELKVMIYVNGHKNIIDLIGANTEELKNGLAYIFVELCPLGSLQTFLLNNQNNFVSQLVQGDTIEVNLVTYSNIALSADTIFTADLALWVFQIASGMAYLENKKVIHADLATRNVLLVNRETVKITDFGLARQLFNNQIYQKTSRHDPLPWKWMAIESLRSFTFSSKSDVWSFGITLWEVFSLGEVPYPGLDWTPDFVEKLENNLRMTQPKYAPDEIFSVMIQCWNPDPDERPHFEFLANYFAEYLRKFPHVEKYFDGDCGCGGDYESGSYV